ncbi:MAG: hypothetical protein QNJ42_08320 [Crocosphaera sp.]|nr:hypothetical protein [Crocosphaera sp.]
MKDEWKKWTKKDFTKETDKRTTKNKALILGRAATEAKLKEYLDDNIDNYDYEQGLTLDAFDLLIGESEEEGILELSQTKIDEIQKTILQREERKLSYDEVVRYIGGSGEQNDGWRVKGLSFSSCNRFLRGEELRNRVEFKPFAFLCNLLKLNQDTDNSITYHNHNISITHQDNDIKILNKLKDELKKQSEDITSMSKVLKSYLVSIEKNKKNEIIWESLDELMERILNYQKPILLNLLNSLVKDDRLKEVEKRLFDNGINNLKNKLKISETDFNQWISEPLKSENLEPPTTNPEEPRQCYLILKIEPNSSNHEQKTKLEYQLQAWFLPFLEHKPEGKDYQSLNTIIKNHEIEQKKEYFSQEEIKPILTELITTCLEKDALEGMDNNSQLFIECFTSKEFFFIDIDCWEWELQEDTCQIKRHHPIYIHIRCLSRLEKEYEILKFKEEWIRRWNAVQQSFNSLDEDTEQRAIKDPEWYFSQSSTVWGNICVSTSESKEKFLENQKTLFKKILKYGIPIAIWSRCHEQATTHRQEINNLIEQCNGQVQFLPQFIKNKRIEAPSNLNNDPQHLGHHLSLLWEDPTRDNLPFSEEPLNQI